MISAAKRQDGFTIVEFMIATSVFGVVLLIVTAAVLFFGRTYQNSLYASATQAAAGNLVDVIGQSVKFSSTPITSTTHSSGTRSYCVGTKQYLYVIGRQLDGGNPSNTTRNAVVSRQNNSCLLESIITAQPSGGPQELLGKGMRLAKLDITVPNAANPALYRVTAKVIYGDDDLLCSPNRVPGSCDETAGTLTAAQFQNPTISADLTCKPLSGSEFCTSSELSSTVYRRL